MGGPNPPFPLKLSLWARPNIRYCSALSYASKLCVQTTESCCLFAAVDVILDFRFPYVRLSTPLINNVMNCMMIMLHASLSIL